MINLEQKFIKHLENCVVPKEYWGDRDTCSAHKTIATIWALFKSGHTYEIWSDYKTAKNAKQLSLTEFFSEDNLAGTNIIYFYGVQDFENDFGYELDEFEKIEYDSYYCPTPTALKAAKGKDWY